MSDFKNFLVKEDCAGNLVVMQKLYRQFVIETKSGDVTQENVVTKNVFTLWIKQSETK